MLGAGLKQSCKYCKDKMFVFELNIIGNILLEGGDVEIIGCTISYPCYPSKMRNVVRWLKLLEGTGVRK